MVILLSPSKSINPKPVAANLGSSSPQFLEQSAVLAASLNKLGADLAKTLGVSDKLAEENRQRFKDWSQDGQFPAAWSYRGEVYAGLSAESLDKASLEAAQSKILIVSGLYGLLRPKDLILPYRLEMSTRLSGPWGKNLYQFWGNTLANYISEQNPVFILNCASEEYFKAIRPDLPDSITVVTPKFLAHSPDGPKPKMAFAKYTRGLMARWAVQNNPKNPKDVLEFDAEGYKYAPDLSATNQPAFLAPKDFSLKGRWNKQ